jgi:hypothetical protein
LPVGAKNWLWLGAPVAGRAEDIKDECDTAFGVREDVPL